MSGRRVCVAHYAAIGLLALIALVSGCRPVPSAPSAVAVRHYGGLSFRPCTLAAATSTAGVQAHCARLQVAEDRSRPHGRRITLQIAWLEAGLGGGTPDPVLFLAGGPGQAASDTAAVVAAALGQVRQQRDVFLVDQRGSGGSQPLRCLDASGQALPVPTQAGVEALTDYARDCANALHQRADVRQYTTTAAVADLDAVRAALGVERLNLVAVSYGTRVAQQYAARHPTRVRTLILDGVVPNDLVVGGEFATTFEQAIAQQAVQCRRDPACARRFPVDLRQQLRQVVARLREAPVTVDYRDPLSAEPRRGTLGAETVGALALQFSYAPQTAALLPLVFDEAAAARYAALMALAELSGGQFAAQINLPMQWSVICTEDADRYQPTSVSASLLGADVAQRAFAACAVWPHGQRPAGFTAPLRGSVPTLLLSGELDPVTPPRYAQRVLAGLDNGRHLIAPGQGHNVMGLGCMPRLLARFLEHADARGLEAGCVASMARVPAFVSFNGWVP